MSNATQPICTARAGKHLTFQLAAEVYGIEIQKVQEIIGMMPVTHVPRVPRFVRGVINLRGRVIPVVDLRVKFEMESQADTERTCIIVVQVMHEETMVVMGILVDEVCEVFDIKDEQLEPPPAFGSSIETDFIMGMGKIGERIVVLLDIDSVLTGDEMDAIARPGTAA